MVEIFLLLIGLHFVGDFPFQNTFMALNKVRSGPNRAPWWYVLTAHASIHGLFVGVATGYVWLGLAEVVAHWLSDLAKGEGWIGFKTDQIIHVTCKLLWAGIAIHYGVWWAE